MIVKIAAINNTMSIAASETRQDKIKNPLKFFRFITPCDFFIDRKIPDKGEYNSYKI